MASNARTPTLGHHPRSGRGKPAHAPQEEEGTKRRQDEEEDKEEKHTHPKNRKETEGRERRKKKTRRKRKKKEYEEKKHLVKATAAFHGAFRYLNSGASKAASSASIAATSGSRHELKDMGKVSTRLSPRWSVWHDHARLRSSCIYPNTEPR